MVSTCEWHPGVALQALQRPVRVMRIITRLCVSGPPYQAIFLTQRLQGSEFVSRLLAGNVSENEGSLDGLARERGVMVNRIPGLEREISLRTEIPALGEIYREIRRFRPDIVHTHHAKAGALGRVAARAARVPIVCHTYHGHVFHSYFSPTKTKCFIRLERMLARWTDRLVVLSEVQKQEILGYGVGRPEQMAVIPLGLELDSFLQAEKQQGRVRAELGMGGQVPLVGIVARLVPIKAHDLFLQAARQIAQVRPDVQFLVVGDGELREPLEEQALRLGLRVVSHRPGAPPVERLPAAQVADGRAIQPCSAIHFLGFRSDLPALYADLNVLLLCSLNEGLPVTIIEALAAARPVVATDVGAVSDLVKPEVTGKLVRSGDAGGLAEAVLEQIAAPERAEAMARHGRRHIYPRLSIDRLEQDIRRLYSELAAARGIAPARIAPGHRRSQHPG
jgi:glycosyltransferase involved in cell wall biosynthesis